MVLVGSGLFFWWSFGASRLGSWVGVGRGLGVRVVLGRWVGGFLVGC